MRSHCNPVSESTGTGLACADSIGTELSSNPPQEQPKEHTRVRIGHDQAMPKYLISFPSEALVLAAEEFPIVAAQAHDVVEQAKAAGVYVFAGGIEEGVDPVLVSADGSVSARTYPAVKMTGGFTVLELPSRQDAIDWATKFAIACGCSQEVREFGDDPQT